MADISKIKINETEYDIKDKTARESIKNIHNIISEHLEENKENLGGKDGVGITKIEKTSTEELVDTYTITFTDNTTTTFTVTNGKDGKDGVNGKDGVEGEKGEDGIGIVSVEKTSTEDLIDTYTITFTDGNTTTFAVTNGKDGVDGENISSGNSLHIESIDAKIIDGEMVGWDKIKTYRVPFTVNTGVVNYVGNKSGNGGKIFTPFHAYENFDSCLAVQNIQNYSHIYFSNGVDGVQIKASVSEKKVSIYNASEDSWIELFDTDGYTWLIIKCVFENGVFKLYGTTETPDAYSTYSDDDYNTLPLVYETTEDNLISVDRTYIDFYYDIPRIARLIVNGKYEKTVEDNTLYNKKIVFTGDSIVAREGNYATLISDLEKCQSINYAWGGSVFTQNDTGTMSMYTKLSNIYVEDADKEYTDIILLEGGVNDALASNDIGTLSDDFATFDNTTFLGALEEYFAEIYSKFPTAKKGFIITYKCPSSTNFGDYVTAIVSACEKWKIPYLNLYNDSGFLCDIEEQKTLYFADNTHINDAGYAMILNKIISFAESL